MFYVCLLLQVSLETEDVSNLDTVISDLSKAVIAAPDQPYPLYSLASSYHRLAGINQSMQLIETARIKFQDALKKFPKFADGLILYALVYYNQFTVGNNRAFQIYPLRFPISCVCSCTCMHTLMTEQGEGIPRWTRHNSNSTHCVNVTCNDEECCR